MLSPETRLMRLDHIFLRFDDLVKHAGALKIETVGGVYLVAANVAGVTNHEHASVLSRLGLQFVAAVREMEAAFRAEVEGFSDSALRLVVRVGVNSGPVIGGVIGKLLPRYRIFGDTVNTAARMETNSEPGRVQLSASSAELLRKNLPPGVTLVPRGEIEVKGKVRRVLFGVRQFLWDRADFKGQKGRVRARRLVCSEGTGGLLRCACVTPYS